MPEVNGRKKPKVVIIGAGFGGVWAARTLAHQPVDVVVVDRNNYHTFLALLYQVAAAELEAEDIAYPVRSILWDLPNVDFVLAHAYFVDKQNHIVKTNCQDIHYDYLIIACGSVSHSFGIPGVTDYAFYLKTLDEAVALKNHIFCCFENASREATKEIRRGFLNFVIVGGGATGVEYAGALSELVHGPLRKDYRNLDFNEVSIILLEASDCLVGNMPSSICDYTFKRLREMGVDVRSGMKVTRVDPDAVLLENGDSIFSRTVVWTAGVKGEPLAAESGIAPGGNNRISVLPTLQVVDQPEIFVIGDLASIKGVDGKTLPQVAQVAIQSGVVAAENILKHASGEKTLPFNYHDRGSMITIGRNSAGVAIGTKHYTGFIAWILWLVIHLFNLIGFRNRIMVLINWAWDYILYERAVRFVFPSDLCCGTKTPYREMHEE
ncbi:MAG: NAD(P)/FAD-dependent oxidoreductase [Syntrophales bacterium]|nr:NAD(P)/FAD-dependent oxidoreductase [Syntrophales bacterium]